MKATGAWFFLLLLALVLMVSGIQGTQGVILAVVFVPDMVVVGDSDASGGGGSGLG